MKQTLLRSLAITAAILGGWLLLGAFYVTQDVVFTILRGRVIPVAEVATFGAVSVAIWMVLTPIILYCTRAGRRGWKARVGIAIAVVLLFAVIRACIGALFVPLTEYRPIALADFGRAIMLQFHANVTLAGILVVARSLYDIGRAIREKDRRALTLETQLARAQLEQLRAQLQPHFLFNAINGIAVLVHTDPERADEMLMELASLLRSTLDLGRSDTIPLRRELELVDHYLRIQTMRFADRLEVRRSIDNAALGCEVPALLLQPLLENSLRHVVAERPQGGWVGIRATRDGDRLRLQIADDGPGFDPDATRLGVGLTNTVARLEQLYRGDASIGFVREHDAFAVTIDLPAKESA